MFNSPLSFRTNRIIPYLALKINTPPRMCVLKDRLEYFSLAINIHSVGV